MREVVVIAHDMRSTHNVGSLLRTAEGLGVLKVYFTGYTPYPKSKKDDRLPFISDKLDKQIQKTALGAQTSMPWEHIKDVAQLIDTLQTRGYSIVALEQAAKSTKLPLFKPTNKVALLLGREVEGIDASFLKLCDEIVEIPMHGHKESFNVVQAAAMALYHLMNYPFA